MRWTALLLLAGLWPLQAVAAGLDRAAFVALGTSVLRIEAIRAGGGYALGSGVAVGPDRVVTNCHVTRDAREIHVVRGGARWRAVAQAADTDRDLCLLQVPGVSARSVPLGRATELRVGQSVVALGYTGGIEISSSAGEVVELHRHDGASVIQSSNRFNSGASGGGLFDDDGRLVGILTFRLRGGEAHYFAAPVEWVRQMLDDQAPEAYREVMPLATANPPYWQRPPLAQPRFLKAATLRREQRWAELAVVAREWLRDDATDAEGWEQLGLALEQSEGTAAARSAYECALRIEPARRQARRRLAALPEAAAAADVLTDPAACPVEGR
jgi:serine protease Do